MDSIDKKFEKWENVDVLRSREDIIEYCKAIEYNWTDEELRTYLSDQYIEKLQDIYARFKKKLSNLKLPPVQECWAYLLFANDFGITLYYCYYTDVSVEEEKIDFAEAQRHLLLREPAKLLTLEEFANIYSVEVNTVRQWIRRAKIKNAKKTADGWRISELTNVSPYKLQRDQYGLYEFAPTVQVLPEYDFMKGYTHLQLYPGGRGKPRIIELSSNDKKRDSREMKHVDAVKFEYYLISHSEIENREHLVNIEINEGRGYRKFLGNKRKMK